MASDARGADETLLLPYHCKVERGRVVLTPAPTPAQRHKIIGARTSHAFTACQPRQADRCRTWQIHKFELSCGGARVAWLEVAEAALALSPGRGRVRDGRLELMLGPQWHGTATEATAYMAFPAGYAPALQTGARFVGSEAPPPTVVTARDPGVAKGGPVVRAAKAAESRESPVPQSDPSLRPTAIGDSWTTMIIPSAADAWRLNLWRAIGGLGLVVAGWGLLITLRRRRPAEAAIAAEAGRDTPTAARPDNDTDDASVCAEMIARAVNLHRAARDAAAAIETESLRNILSDDLAGIQMMLLAPDLTAHVAEGRWASAKTIVKVALSDLERVARIIAGVLSSAPGRPAPNLPTTSSEAFEVLGINPSASRTVVKKIVDGLRQSWHPDHARDGEDQAAREARMKQINVAWDLIRQHQGAAEQSAA